MFSPNKARRFVIVLCILVLIVAFVHAQGDVAPPKPEEGLDGVLKAVGKLLNQLLGGKGGPPPALPGAPGISAPTP